MKYTYILLHPCSSKYIQYIFDKLKQENFFIIGVYRIINWESILNNIYKNSYIKSKSVEEHVLSHAYINKYLFGDCGLIILLFKCESYETLVQDTLCIKKEIRDHMNNTKNGIISISLNVNKSIYHKKSLKEDRMVETFLSYVHCPDTVEQYYIDFENLKCYLSEDKRLSTEEIDNIIKFRSYYC